MAVNTVLCWQCIMHDDVPLFHHPPPYTILDIYLGGLTLISIGRVFMQRMFSSMGKVDFFFFSSCPSLALLNLRHVRQQVLLS
jgi:hypothetical protein